MTKRCWYLVGFILFFLAMYLGMRYIMPLIFPFAFGGFLALILEPIVKFMQKKLQMPRSLAAGITIVSCIAATAFLLILLSARVSVDVRGIISHLPYYSRIMVEAFQMWAARTPAFYLHLPQPVLLTIEESIGQLYNLTGTVLAKLLGSLASVTNLVLNLIVSFIVAFFISRDRMQLMKWVYRFLPPQYVEHLRRLEKEVMTGLVGFVWAQLILVTITTLITIVGLLLLKIRYAFFLGLISGLLDIIPVLGPTLLFLPWIIIAVMTGDVALAIGLAIVYAAMNVVRQVLQARVIGSRTGLHPLAVLLSLYLGMRLLGPSGVIAGPLTLILLSAILRLGVFNDFTKS